MNRFPGHLEADLIIIGMLTFGRTCKNSDPCWKFREIFWEKYIVIYFDIL